MELDILRPDARTEVGSYFIANYPPFSAWSAEAVPEAIAMLAAADDPAAPRRPLGLYLHIPFCRKRCKFCYFRVYTDKNASEVDVYMDALAREIELYKDRPRLAGRQFEFVYFGGGTPSFLSSDQLSRLVERINRTWRWDAAREVTFECEPGTLKKGKLETIRGIGVTRLSLGIEHWDDAILEANGRAHRSKEIGIAYDWAREVGFPQINVDLIAGMIGDTDDGWRRAVDRTLALAPDSVTIYQMELPHNAVFSKEAKAGGEVPVADWPTKRRWVAYAFEEFEKAGYEVSSGYTLVKHVAQPPSAVSGSVSGNVSGNVAQPPSAVSSATQSNGKRSAFVYRDALWHGGDLVGTGVASFSHVAGVHYQNEDRWENYVARVQAGELPLARGMTPTPEQRLIRELILQTKLGRLDLSYFREKFGVDARAAFAEAFDSLAREGYATLDGDRVRLTREGLLRVDALLPRFFEPRFRGVRYT